MHEPTTSINKTDARVKSVDNVLTLSDAMIEKTKSRHCAEVKEDAYFFTNVLSLKFMIYNRQDFSGLFRVHFLLGPGHMLPVFYTASSLVGHYFTEALENFRQWNGITGLDFKRGIKNTCVLFGRDHTNAIDTATRFVAVHFCECTTRKTYLTASLPVTLRDLIGPRKSIGLDHCDHSAPIEVLYKHFGYTTENVYN